MSAIWYVFGGEEGIFYKEKRIAESCMQAFVAMNSCQWRKISILRALECCRDCFILLGTANQ